MFKKLLKAVLSPGTARKASQPSASLDSESAVKQGFAAMHCGQFQEALQLLEMAARILVNRRDVIEAIGYCNKKLGRLDAAYEIFLELQEGDPTGYKMLVYQSDILHAQRHYRDALDKLLTAQTMAPNDVTIDAKLGEIYLRLDAFEEAKFCYEKCSNIDNPPAAVLNGHALVLREFGRVDEALSSIERAVAMDSENPSLFTNLALIYQDLGQHAMAYEYFQRALKLDPHHSLASIYVAFTLIAQERFGEGWDAFENRWNHPDVPPPSTNFEPWSGRSAKPSSLLVTAEQGIGDEIMFASCIPDLLKVQSSIILECNDKLVDLFSRAFPMIEVIPRNQYASPRWKKLTRRVTHQVAIGSLPRFFRRERRHFPQHSGYLTADKQRVQHWRNLFSLHCQEHSQHERSLKIGLSWRGGRMNTRRHLRSLSLVDLGFLLETPNCQFINLQYDFTETEQDTLPSTIKSKLFTDFEIIRNLDETAAAISAVDLVITVQTALAHLSGALNKPAWVLISTLPEWRYGHTGESMLWYPSTRLFRQTIPMEWRQSLETIARELNVMNTLRVSQTDIDVAVPSK